MAIATVSAVYDETYPNASGQIVTIDPSQLGYQFGVQGTATSTLDGTLTSGTLNLIDGTKTLSFTPTKFVFGRIGGTAVATLGISSIVPVDNKTATVSFTAAGTNTHTVQYFFIAIP